MHRRAAPTHFRAGIRAISGTNEARAENGLDETGRLRRRSKNGAFLIGAGEAYSFISSTW